jgi:hypothetical protein
MLLLRVTVYIVFHILRKMFLHFSLKSLVKLICASFVGMNENLK